MSSEVDTLTILDLHSFHLLLYGYCTCSQLCNNMSEVVSYSIKLWSSSIINKSISQTAHSSYLIIKNISFLIKILINVYKTFLSTQYTISMPIKC